MLSYGAVDKNGNIYMSNMSLLKGFSGSLLEQENMQGRTFWKITGVSDGNNSIQYLDFNMILDDTSRTAQITSVQNRSVDCIFPLYLINSDCFFMKLFRESIDDLGPVFNGGIAYYNFTISKEDGKFIGHSVQKPIENVSSNAEIGEFTDVGCDFSVDKNGFLYYTGSITELNHKFFPLSLYGYQADWKKIISAVITLKIGDNTMFNNNIESKIPTPPTIINGRTLIPIREVIEAFGGQVEWDEENSTATIMMPKYKLVLTIGSLNCIVNNEIIVADVAPQIIDNKTYLPLRFVCENIGASVYWEEVGDKITIVR